MKKKIDLNLSPPVPPEKRIYCVVANTVQAPLNEVSVANPVTNRSVTKFQFLPDTKTTFQPAGRLMAQGEHVVSKTRDWMLKRLLMDKLDDIRNSKPFDVSFSMLEPVTTINLGCRDSYELLHIYETLKFAGIKVYDFHDTKQPDYGSPDLIVRTAIATEPVLSEEVAGLLDYLPLWEPNPWDVKKRD